MNDTFSTTVPSDLTVDSEGINEGMFADSGLSSSRISLNTTGAQALYKCLDMREPITGSAKQAYQRYAKAASNPGGAGAAAPLPSPTAPAKVPPPVDLPT